MKKKKKLGCLLDMDARRVSVLISGRRENKAFFVCVFKTSKMLFNDVLLQGEKPKDKKQKKEKKEMKEWGMWMCVFSNLL